MSTPIEHETFAKFIDSLNTAADTAKQLGALRDDVRWAKIAELIVRMREHTYDLATQGTLK